jgi:DNA-binding NtrC family response regulator
VKKYKVCVAEKQQSLIKINRMNGRKLNLFIVADNVLIVNGLRHYLLNRFGESIQVSNFYDRRSCLRKLNKETQIVVLDQKIAGREGQDTAKTIKKINPQTVVIMHSSNEEVAASVAAFQSGSN